jgi:hypothetical protein
VTFKLLKNTITEEQATIKCVREGSSKDILVTVDFGVPETDDDGNLVYVCDPDIVNPEVLTDEELGELFEWLGSIEDVLEKYFPTA